MDNLVKALERITEFRANSLTVEIDNIERSLATADKKQLLSFCENKRFDKELFDCAVTMKQASAQINIIIHSIGILLSLPHILDDDEKVEYLSLGAGNTGKKFDLKTDRQIAEFKFINWQGGAETIRQNNLFKDFVNLAEYDDDATIKSRKLYLVGIEQPQKFLEGSRQINSALSHSPPLLKKIQLNHPDCQLVKDYYHVMKSKVELVDLLTRVPEISKLLGDAETDQGVF